jgi:hypothetical protein
MRVLAVLALVAGCSPCDGTDTLTMQLPSFAAGADQLEVLVGGAVSQFYTAAHTPGDPSATVKIKPVGYTTGQGLPLQVTALQQGQAILISQRTATAPAACGAISLDLSVTEVDVRVEQNLKNKVDLLFMVDDSPSMAPKQMELKARFPELIKVLDDFGAKGNPAWYHIGVVTSDLGAGPTAASANCKPGGQGARLQSLGKAHVSTCLPPGNGLNFIDYNQLNGTNNLPASQDLVTTFNCMASVGDTGCGFEHQLESVYRALHDCMPDATGSYPNCIIPQNVGFLRPDSVLVVVFVTDEDDCSASPTTDLFDLNRTGQYGALLSYRCTNYGIQCGTQLMPYADSGGPLSDCHSAPNLNDLGPGKLFDVSRYVSFFKSPLAQGGVRIDPADVVLSAIDAPEMPVQSIVANPATGQPCAAGAQIDGTNCAVTLAHSCNASTTFFGDPAVRINQVLSQVNAQSATASICSMDYTPALTKLGQQITSKLGVSCISSPLASVNDPQCTVEDLANTDDSVVDTIQSCAQSNNAQPCWQYVADDHCAQIINPNDGSITQGSIHINRDPSSIPPGTHATVRCLAAATPNG